MRYIRAAFRTTFLFMLATTFILLTGCRKKGCTDSTAENFDANATKNDGSCVFDSLTYGIVTVDLTAEKSIVRTKEALIGNLTADAFYEYGISKGQNIDFALVNGGNLRFDPVTRPDGIYPAGKWNLEMVNELLPFGNNTMVVTVTGKELKSVLERSVASLPNSGGQFFQVSSQLVVTIDTSLAAQTIDDFTDPNNPVILTEGSRITGITINSVVYDTLQNYHFITNSYIGEGQDGFVTLKGLSSTNRLDLGDKTTVPVINYLQNRSPVTPVFEGRIVIE